MIEIVYPEPPPMKPGEWGFKIKGHSSSSQIVEGCCPFDCTRETLIVELKSRGLDGTFGGRIEQCGSGRFRYIAYTD
jgi:hypothetical protein